MTVSYSSKLFVYNIDSWVNFSCLTHNKYVNQFINETYEYRNFLIAVSCSSVKLQNSTNVDENVV